MRIIGEIPHPIFKITLFHQNNRYSVKIAADRFEQIYKFRDGVVTLEDLKERINGEFLQEAESVFRRMRMIQDDCFRPTASTDPGDEFEEII